MSNKKYQIKTTPKDNGWSAEIIRKVSARKSTITKSQGGFASEAEASAWADTELQALLKVLIERNKRRAK